MHDQNARAGLEAVCMIETDGRSGRNDEATPASESKHLDSARLPHDMLHDIYCCS